MVVLAASSEVLVGSNHFLRDHEPWEPFVGTDNGLDDTFGLLRVSGNDNSVIGNHFSEVLDPASIRPAGATPVIIRVAEGEGNYIASNHVVAREVRSATGGSAFEAQVEALLSTEEARRIPVTAVLVDTASTGNTVLDSGTEAQVRIDPTVNAFRATPGIP